LIETSPQIAVVQEMERLIGEGEWDAANEHFTVDVTYTVGSGATYTGVAGIRAYMDWQNGIVRWRGHTLREQWNADDVVVIQIDSHFVRQADDRPVTVRCTDIYCMAGDNIRDWRV